MMDKFLGYLLILLPRLWISKLVRLLSGIHLYPLILKPVIGFYCRCFNVNLEETQIPPGGFRSFRDFFVRPLKEGSRPLAPGHKTWVSPCDGKIYNFGSLKGGQKIEQIKGVDYTLEELVGGSEWNQPFEQGQFFTIYLSPRDYHRVHAPLEGHIVRCRYIPGDLWPVNSIGLKTVPGLFVRNERVVMEVDSPQGPYLVVMVGAFNVGSIKVTCDPALRTNYGHRKQSTQWMEYPVQKGEEIGRFEMGSTVILILPPTMKIEWTLREGRPIKLGEKLGEPYLKVTKKMKPL